MAHLFDLSAHFLRVPHQDFGLNIPARIPYNFMTLISNIPN